MRKQKTFLTVVCMLVFILCTCMFAVQASAADSVTINAAAFPDGTFRAYVSANLDTNHDGTLSSSEIAAVTTLSLSNRGIKDLTGILYFTALTRLECKNNKLTALDLSKNTALTYVDVGNAGTVNGAQATSYNHIETLNLSGCTALTYLDCSDNALSKLTLTTNTKLKTLLCSGNNITLLSVNMLTSLETLSCASNGLTSLLLTRNTQLTELDCSGNGLRTLNVSPLTKLETLECSNNRLAKLDLSKNTLLTSLSCGGNLLTALDVSKNTALTTLACEYNLIGVLDVSANTQLTSLTCDNNCLYALNTGSLTGLTHISFGNNMFAVQLSNREFDLSTLRGFDVSKVSNLKSCSLSTDGTKLVAHIANMPKSGSFDYAYNDAGDKATFYVEFFVNIDEATFPDEIFRNYLANEKIDLDGDGTLSYEERVALKQLDVSRLGISSLTGIEYLTALQVLKAENNRLSGTLNFYNNKNLTHIYLCNYAKTNGEVNPYHNALTSLQVSACTNLVYLDCRNNALTTLSLIGKSSLQALLCSNNNLRTLTVGGCTKLSTLYCDGNALATLTISTTTSLLDLNCSKNALTSLNISKCVDMRVLDCSQNKISSLSLSANPDLLTLRCDENDMTALDLSAQKDLRVLSCGRNALTTIDTSANTKLTEFVCDYNALTSLNLANNTALLTLSCDGNDLTTLSLSANKALSFLSCNNNQLTHLDLNNNKDLATLNCNGNVRKITLTSGTFDVTTLGNGFDHTKAWDWTDVYTVNNGMKSNGILTAPANASHIEYTYQCSPYYIAQFTLDIELADVAITADTFTDPILLAYVTDGVDTNIDGVLSSEERKAVTYLDLNGLGLTSLDGIEVFSELKELHCDNNALTALNVSGNRYLRTLSCADNAITALDLSDNAMITFVQCQNNKIESITMGENPALTHFDFSGNCVTSLDLSGSPALQYVDSTNNIYEVKSNGGIVKLSDLPGSFDVEKSLAWGGATLSDDGTQLTVNEGVTKVTYTYTCSDGYSTTFVLSVKPSIVVSGDVNKDGVVNTADVVYLIRHLALASRFPLPEGISADYTHDGAVTAADVSYLIRHITLPNRFPITQQ